MVGLRLAAMESGHSGVLVLETGRMHLPDRTVPVNDVGFTRRRTICPKTVHLRFRVARGQQLPEEQKVIVAARPSH